MEFRGFWRLFFWTNLKPSLRYLVYFIKNVFLKKPERSLETPGFFFFFLLCSFFFKIVKCPIFGISREIRSILSLQQSRRLGNFFPPKPIANPLSSAKSRLLGPSTATSRKRSATRLAIFGKIVCKTKFRTPAASKTGSWEKNPKLAPSRAYYRTSRCSFCPRFCAFGPCLCLITGL